MTSTVSLNDFIDNIQHRRYRYRQFFGVAYIILVSIVGIPDATLFNIGLVLVLLGESVRMWASGHVNKNAVLATDGPYAYVRHPLYVGNILILSGFSLAASLWWTIPLLIVFLVIFYPHTIRVEDEKLHKLFKKEWEDWRSERNALIPRLGLFRKAPGGDWSFKQSLRKNGEPVIALFLFACLYLLYTNLP